MYNYNINILTAVDFDIYFFPYSSSSSSYVWYDILDGFTENTLKKVASDVTIENQGSYTGDYYTPNTPPDPSALDAEVEYSANILQYGIAKLETSGLLEFNDWDTES